jgi:oligoribonuclease
MGTKTTMSDVAKKEEKNIWVWVDLEMTGLTPETCAVLEMAMIITDEQLRPLAEIERVIWQPDSALETMDPFVRKMHTDNGLLERVRASKHGLADVEREMLALLTQFAGYREAVLAGNSIHQDRRFLCRYMPHFEHHLHYRQIDVSSWKVGINAWLPAAKFPKAPADHTALSDIRASLAEFAHYRKLLREA